MKKTAKLNQHQKYILMQKALFAETSVERFKALLVLSRNTDQEGGWLLETMLARGNFKIPRNGWVSKV